MSGEIVKTEPNGMAVLGGVDQMQKDIANTEEARSIIIDYIQRNFVKGIDYGPTDPRSDKPTLKKPGAEKICRLFNTRPTWTRDFDTWKMLGKPAGVVCYLCQIVHNETGSVVGEGRGAEKVGTKGRDENKTIKNAEKCSLVDAALYTFCLSETYTQDDGGRLSTPTMSSRKQAILEKAEDIISNKKNQWGGDAKELVVKCIEEFNGEKSLDTLGAINEFEKVWPSQYDMNTGEKMPR